jgi:hypothetical protein
MIWMVFIILLCVGCRPEATDEWAIELVNPVPSWQDGELEIIAGVNWRPSPAVIEALDHGVVVPIRVITRTSRHHGWIAMQDRDRNHRFEIRYLPLVRNYQVLELKTGRQENYPRLSMAMEALSTRRGWATGLNREEAARRDWQVEIRAELDRSRLPSPMRIPVWFDPEWRSSSPWHGWRIDADAFDGA